jgi:hypothetical protein
MQLKKRGPYLTPVQKGAIEQARNGEVHRLILQIGAIQRTLDKLRGPVNDDPLGRWTVKMRDHYGNVLGQLKSAAKECGIDLRKAYAKPI